MMVITTKIEQIFHNDKDRDGNLLTFKTGRNAGQTYTKVSLKVDHPDFKGLYLDGFGGPISSAWKVGDEITTSDTGEEADALGRRHDRPGFD